MNSYRMIIVSYFSADIQTSSGYDILKARKTLRLGRLTSASRARRFIEIELVIRIELDKWDRWTLVIKGAPNNGRAFS